MTDIDYIKCGDCLELMSDIQDKSINMILCDLPYGRTHNSWDKEIPFDPLWKQYERIIKDNGVIALFGDGLFMAELMLSNKKMWRYNLIWDKVLPSGFLNANRQPLRQHEEIVMFYKKQPVYNPQKTKGKKNHGKGKEKVCVNNNYSNFDFVDNDLGGMKHPKSILTFPKNHPSQMIHPTQKPVELLEYLIRTYTNEGDIVLDNCMGSGSTCVAAVNTDRHYIGFELDPQYFDIARSRIEEAENIRNNKKKVCVNDKD